MTTAPAAFENALSDRYRIEREIGRGGMATVYLADDLKHRRRVAIKVMHPEMAAAIGHDRFLREIEIAARLTHPHILPLHDSGAADGMLYYVMPYIAGESLRGRLGRERQLPLEEALRLAREIASALGHAHQQGLVHRDIKPENVLLADGIALVADFGIARVSAGPSEGGATQVATRAATGAGITLGTPAYMAPEQALAAHELDGRADQYALACVLYEMLAGQPPFSAPTLAGIIARHANDPVPPLRSARPGVSDALERVIEKALAKSPADRHATMARFAEALAIAVGVVRTPTPLPSAHESKVPNNLPKHRTSFVGRERELAECARLMGETRLLTLTGVGGCGKTRLGLRLAESLMEAHPHGVWWVDLAPVSDDSRLPLTLASSIGVQEEPGHPLLETLGRHFENQNALIVLDNCEHLLQATSDAADVLLSTCDHVRLIVTSREGLGISGEHVFALRSLAVPSVQAQGDIRAIEAADAVKLFVDRARQAAPDFALTPPRAPVVAEICRRLDGMPLAIELAAARVRMLTVEQIRDRLDDRFKLLTGGSKALPRHQTLRATIQWSYDQLEADEQRLFRNLGVFAGGWTLAAAVAVAWDDADEFEVLDLLTRLVDKSLVTVDREEGGEARYAMLETVRQFALEVLHESPERDAVRDRHLDHFVAYTAAYYAEDANPYDINRRLDRELENVLAAHAWAGQSSDGAPRGLDLLAPLKRYWPDRGLFDLGMRVTQEALSRPGPPTPGRAAMTAVRGDMHYYSGQYEDAMQAGREALAMARAMGDSSALIAALDCTASATYACGHVDEARALCQEYIEAARQEGDRRALSAGLTYLGEIHRAEGDLDAAIALYDELLPLVRQQGMAIALINFAMTLTARGRYDEALPRLHEALAVVLGTESRRLRLSLVDATGPLAVALGDAAAGARLIAASDAGFARLNSRREPADERFQVPFRAQAEDKLGREAIAAAMAAGRDLPLEAAFAEAAEWIEAASASRTTPRT